MPVLCQDLSNSWRGFPGTCSRVNLNIKSVGVVSYMGAAQGNKNTKRCKIIYFFSDGRQIQVPVTISISEFSS